MKNILFVVIVYFNHNISNKLALIKCYIMLVAITEGHLKMIGTNISNFFCVVQNA